MQFTFNLMKISRNKKVIGKDDFLETTLYDKSLLFLPSKANLNWLR